MNKIINNKLNFIDYNINLNMKFQTLKKWIYVNYNGNEMINIIVNDIDFVDTTIIDNNNYELYEIKKMTDKIIPLFNIIFTKSEFYKASSKQFKKIVVDMYDVKKYYEIDGIKIHMD